MLRPLLITLALFGLYPLVAIAADTYVLKNGDKLIGDLIRETEDAYVVQVHLAPTIREEQVIAKSRVVRIIKPELGLAEFETLRDLIPTPDGLREGDYQSRIELVTQFIENFPANRNIRKAIDIRDELRDELRQVREGAIKIDGVLYPATELRENRYELDARIDARKIKELAAMGQYLGALKAYSEFQKEFNHTKVHLDLIPLIQKLITAHANQAVAWLDTLEVREEQRIKGLDRMTPGDRRDSERAIEAEKENLRRRYLLETVGEKGWVTLHPFCKEALNYTEQYAKAELRKIENLLAKEFIDCGQLYRELYLMKKQGADERVVREKLRLMQRANVPDRYREEFSSDLGNR